MIGPSPIGGSAMHFNQFLNGLLAAYACGK